MIKKYKEFVNEGMMSKMWRELDGTEERDEEKEIHVDVNIEGVDEHHSFTDSNGVLHKNGYKINNCSLYALKKLITTLIGVRGNKCSLNDIDISNFTNLGYLFKESNFNGDISGWDVSNVTDFTKMFYWSKFEGTNCNLSNWKLCSDKEKNIIMTDMFNNSKFKGDISSWDVSRVLDMISMFQCCDFDGDLSKWDVSNVTSFKYMFKEADFTGKHGGISNWKFYNGGIEEEPLIDFAGMFAYSKFESDISNWKVNENKDELEIFTTNMFFSCPIKEEYKPKFAR